MISIPLNQQPNLNFDIENRDMFFSKKSQQTDKKCRDPRGEYKELTEYIDMYTEGYIHKRQDELEIWEAKGLPLGSILSNKLHWFEYETKIILRKYARGDNPKCLVSDIEHAIETLSAAYAEAYQFDEQHDMQDDGRRCYVSVANIIYGLRFALFMECLISDAKLKHRFANSFSENEDKVLDIVLAKFDPERKVAENIKYPEVIGFPDFIDLFLLEEIVEAPEDERQGLVEEYLEEYEKNIKDHTPYWCFELALIIKLFNFDDSYLENHSHYPWELVKSAREFKP